MSLGARSTSPAPLQGLLVIALAGILCAVAGSILRRSPSYLAPGRSIFPRDAPIRYSRTVSAGERSSLATHYPWSTSRNGPAGGPISPALSTGSRFRADCAVTLHEKPPSVTLEKIPGELLLIAGRPIDLNRADYRDLQAVPGIGRRLAMAIIRYREDRGSFSSLDELARIPGLGPKKLTSFGPYLHVAQTSIGGNTQHPPKDVPRPVS